MVMCVIVAVTWSENYGNKSHSLKQSMTKAATSIRDGMCFHVIHILKRKWWYFCYLSMKIFVVVLRADPGSEFVASNTLAKWKKLEPNGINFCQGFSQKVASWCCFVFNSVPASETYLLIIFKNSLDPEHARQNVGPDVDPKCLTPIWCWKKSNIRRVKYGTIIKCEGIQVIKAIFENPKADKNTLFSKYIIFEPPRLYF